MRIVKAVRKRLRSLTVRERLNCSNILMVLIPVAITLLTAAGAIGIAFYAFAHFYLPRMGLELRDLHDMGEAYEGDLKSFGVLLVVLGVVMLAFLLLTVILTNRFLVRFMLRRVEEPLALLTEGAARIREGDLDTAIGYDRPDEFLPVCEAFDRMAERLRDNAERAACEEQSRRELFAGISHDLRSPLTSVRAYTEALLDGVAKTPEDTRRYLTKIRTHEAEIERMVEALFLYTKMELRDYPVHPETLFLPREIARICEENPMDHLTVDTGGVGALSAVADPFLLERVAVNLLDNSRKYRRGDTASVTVTAERAGEHVRLSFRDDGIGVSEEALPRLFDPFYRADPARANPAGGSGLGLAIVREAVSHMGGRVWAQSPADGGLCVHILLPEVTCSGEHPDH